MIRETSVEIEKSIIINLVWCPPGTFTLKAKGTSLFYKTKMEEVTVTFSSGFWISKYPVTLTQWLSVQGKSDRFHAISNPNLPIYGIDYKEAIAYLTRLNDKNSSFNNQLVEFSFPNYLEWLYACLAKETNNISDYNLNYNDLLNVAWFNDNSEGRVREIGLKKSNAWGIYDMYGNIYEICDDIDVNEGDCQIINPKSVMPRETIIAFGGCFLASLDKCQLAEGYNIGLNNTFIEPLGIRLIFKPKIIT